ncbi:aromatic ring-hydroxylating dioxygenase subunit alpha [Bradyrhizobium canariense]|uniref:Rieske [2Fe-2S] domain-containing protein n=1 Tax=Bradyrhizobium canariense TaxID=255045 RepID=A0A1H1SKA6_9BRAD|nr:aromatic ring-hydroxylating dioxygenase subunit alpha [Bradyrhizobium canariense]SDS48268.1 Rieske [2Fe-2S] domain-containing protein [Bradyrhizobium canariense]
MAKAKRPPFGGFYNQPSIEDDAELTRVGPGTPCGNYLRRFWQPIAMVSEVKDMPIPVRALGEDLVLFRDKSGRLGLVHKRCSHRGTSLEYGIIGEQGIRCAYHGWAFDIDGTVLETPSEPQGSRLREAVCQGAYRTHEFAGLVFAYMGPPEETPDFPVYDTLVWPDGNHLVPYKLDMPCNWLQVHENAADPIHTAYLHSIVTGVQFTPAFAELPTIEFLDTPLGLLSVATRRVGEQLWIRASDVILPNVAQFGTGFVDGSKEKFALCAAFTRWIVPLDDTNCIVIGVRHFNDVIDPLKQGREDQIGLGKIDLMGQTDERPYAERQKSPGDWDAMVAQGPITVHRNENLSSTDKGVAQLRRQIRTGVRALQAGGLPAQPRRYGKGIVPTYNNETILRVPRLRGDDVALIRNFGHMVCNAAIESAELPPGPRQRHVEDVVRAMQDQGAFYVQANDRSSLEPANV